MSEFVSRDELKLHQDLLEQKAETRAAQLQGRMDSMERRLDGRLDVLGTKFDTLAGQVATIASGQAEFRAEMRGELRSEIGSVNEAIAILRRENRDESRLTRNTLVVTAITSLLAVMGVLYTAQSTTVAALGNQLNALQAGLSIVNSPAPAPRR